MRRMMNKLSFVFLAALSVAALGCKKKGADCDKAIDHSMELSKADMQKMGEDDATIAKMRAIGVDHCKSDKWAGDVVQCMIDAKTEADAQGCYKKLTPEQQTAMNNAAMEAMKPPAGATPPPAPAPDMGSAAAAPAGSAAAAPAAGSAGSSTAP